LMPGVCETEGCLSWAVNDDPEGKLCDGCYWSNQAEDLAVENARLHVMLAELYATSEESFLCEMMQRIGLELQDGKFLTWAERHPNDVRREFRKAVRELNKRKEGE
jgi:hypothetical protein